MTIRRYFPISVGIFVLVCALAYLADVPVAPVAIIILVGETIIGFELENDRAGTIAKGVLRAVFHPSTCGRH